MKFSDDVFAEKFVTLCEDVSTIKEQVSDLPELKEKVEKHDRVYQYGKWTAVPILAVFHVGFKHFLNKIGW